MNVALEPPFFRRPLAAGDSFILAGVALAYFGAHFIALLFPDAQKVLAAIWPPGGIGLAALLLLPRRLWPALLASLFLAGTAADLLFNRPFPLSIGFMTANILESAGCAWLLTRWCGETVRFDRLKEVVALIVAAVCVNALTAVIGAATAALSGKATFGSFWLDWWVADGLSILLIAPLIVTWAHQGRAALTAITGAAAIEWGAFIVLWCVASWSIFEGSEAHHLLQVFPYMLLALLAWPALRFGQHGVTAALVVLAIFMLASSAVSKGPLLWGGGDSEQRLLLSQIFLGVAAISGMLLAASGAESRAAERLAREGEARLRALSDNLPNSMVYQVVRGHDGSMRFLYVSDAVERLHGISAAAVQRDPAVLYGQLVAEDGAAIASAEERSAQDMSVFTAEARVRTPDGQVRWRQLSSSPRRLTDDRILWDGIETDITDQKKAEQALQEKTRQLEDLTRNLEQRVAEEIALRMKNELIMIQQSKLAAMGEMLGAIAHQWRQPLNVVGLIVQGMEDAYAQGKLDGAYLEQTVQKTMAQILRLSKTIDDFRNFYKPDKEKTTFDAMRAVGDVLSLLTAQLAADHIAYRLTCATPGRTFERERDIIPCPETAIEGYRNEFEHAVLNLVNNGRDAILEKRTRAGKDAFEQGHLSFDFAHAERTVVITVRDTGGGIPPAALERIFDPYFTTKDPAKGTGLGLYMAKVIIEDHMGGKLTAANGEAGAVFTIALPQPGQAVVRERSGDFI